jgi:hypothetical protein
MVEVEIAIGLDEQKFGRNLKKRKQMNKISRLQLLVD